MRAYLVSFLGELAGPLAPPTKWPDRQTIVRLWETRLRVQIRRQGRLSPALTWPILTWPRLCACLLRQEREGVSLKSIFRQYCWIYSNCNFWWYGLAHQEKKVHGLLSHLFSLLMFYITITFWRGNMRYLWAFWLRCLQHVIGILSEIHFRSLVVSEEAFFYQT